MKRALFLIASLLSLRAGLAAPPGAARAATLSFSTKAGGGTFPGAVIAKGRAISIDLSSLPQGTEVTRAILRVKRDPPTMSGVDNNALVPIVIRAGGDGPTAAPLLLRAPRFLDFDATGAAQAALGPASRAGERRLLLQVESFPGWKPDGTRLDVTFVPPAPAAPREGADAPSAPRAGEVRAWHRSGQTFITWRGPEVLTAAATIKEVKAAKAKAAKGTEVRYRIYRASQPISSTSIGRADLIDEVDEYTAWNIDFYGLYPQARAEARRYVVEEGKPPLTPGSGVYVHRAASAGKAWYAVVLARDGEEDFGGLDADGGSAGPVEEVPGPGEPVLQRTEKPDRFQLVKGPTIDYYVRWESPPMANVPSRPFDYLVGTPPATRDPAPVCLALHCWGGNLQGGYGCWHRGGEGALLIATNQIPYDWWAVYHENFHTLKSFKEGVVRSYTPRRVWSFLEWVKGKRRIDPERVFLAGNSMGGSGVSHWLRYADQVAFGISWVGVHIPAESPGFRQSYENVAGRIGWGLPHESGAPVFEYLDDARFLRANPAFETPFLAYSNGKNDKGIGWPQAVQFTRALQETHRPHLFVWGQGGHGARAYFPTPEGGGDNVKNGLDIRLGQSLPAFSRCSLDDDLGNGEPLSGASQGQINMYLRWKPADIVDEAGRYAVSVYLIPRAPAVEATVDVTPRRTQKFKPKPGAKATWKATLLEDGSEAQRGEASADRWGLITIEKLQVTEKPRRLEIALP